jgi:phosphoribosylglycinamide formyltransferase-1
MLGGQIRVRIMNETRIGILASHHGTTLQAIIDACQAGSLTATLAVVLTNNSQSGAAQRAQRYAIPCHHLSGQTHSTPEALDRAICATLEQHQVTLVLLAGYMKKLGPYTLKHFRGRVLNTHPALLPKFGGHGMYGGRVYEAVLAAGEAMTGVSVHVVEAEYDQGPVIAQCEVPVLAGDTVATLTSRVQERERRFVVEVIQAIVEGRMQWPIIELPCSAVLPPAGGSG